MEHVVIDYIELILEKLGWNWWHYWIGYFNKYSITDAINFDMLSPITVQINPKKYIDMMNSYIYHFYKTWKSFIRHFKTFIMLYIIGIKNFWLSILVPLSLFLYF